MLSLQIITLINVLNHQIQHEQVISGGINLKEVSSFFQFGFEISINMNRCTKSDIENWIKPTLENLGLHNYIVDISGTSEKGDGFVGDVTFVTVHGDEKNYNFVIKCGKKSKEMRAKMPVRQAFKNEISFYSEVLPEFTNFQKEKNVTSPFCHVPKCYDSLIFEEMEVLILENLKKQGYILHDRYNPMNKEHIRMVVKMYGKLHAISFAMKDQKPEIFKKLSENLIDLLASEERVEKMKNLNRYQRVIDIAKEKHDDEVLEKALILNEKLKKSILLADPTDPFAVIIHGDCWNNNFMFKYEDNQTTTPSDVCFLDFQLSKLASPVYDLSYFLFTCLSEEDTENFDEINNLYYESLSTSLKEMGSDPDKLFPYEELINQWKKFSLFGLSMMPGIIQFCVSEQDEVPDFAENAESGKNFTDIFGAEIKNSDQYRKRTFPILRLVIEKNLIE